MTPQDAPIPNTAMPDTANPTAPKLLRVEYTWTNEEQSTEDFGGVFDNQIDALVAVAESASERLTSALGCLTQEPGENAPAADLEEEDLADEDLETQGQHIADRLKQALALPRDEQEDAILAALQLFDNFNLKDVVDWTWNIYPVEINKAV